MSIRLTEPVRERVPSPGNPTFIQAYQNFRPNVLAAPQLAPADPREIPPPSRPAKMPVFMALAIPAFKAVSSQDNWVRMAAPRPQAAMPKGEMTPFRRFGNIRNDRPESFGSQWELDPNSQTGALTVRFAGVPD